MEKAVFRYFIQIRYLGTAYHGWQVQPNALTVQETIDERLSVLLQTEIRSVGCGRTDAGVHAHDFFLHIDLDFLLSKQACAEMVYKLNRFLPADIAVNDMFLVKPGIHSRFSAISRKYIYSISTSKNPFGIHTSWHYSYDLDVQKLQEAAARLMQYTDFAAFSKKDTDIIGTNCTLMESGWSETEHGLIYTVKANRFLRNMVRALVGTQLKIGKGLIKPEDLDTIVESRDRCRAGESVPAQGLSLVEVRYPDDIRADF